MKRILIAGVYPSTAMDDFVEQLRVEAKTRWRALGRPPPPPHEEHGRVPRVFSEGRGSGCVWILGRTVRALVFDRTVPDMSFDEFLSDGYSDEVVAALGAERVDAVKSAVRELAPRACMCGTGAETDMQHGTIRTLAEGQNPEAIHDDRTTIGYCTHCGRCWSFNECGDSHYSYAYTVTPFDPT